MSFRDVSQVLDESRSSGEHADWRLGLGDCQRLNAIESVSSGVGLMARALVQTTIPHSEQRSLHFQRRNGSLRLTMVGHPDHGLPYGKIPRLLLAWMARKARTAGSPMIELPTSQAALFRDLGLGMSGGRTGSMNSFRDQALRLMKCTIHIDRQVDGGETWQPYQLSSGIRLWWDQPAGAPATAGCWIKLAPSFYEEVMTYAVPLDFRVLIALRSPLAIDIYAWATDRTYRLHKPLSLDWSVLNGQFGADYGRLVDFRKRFERSLGQVLRHWPELRIRTDARGIRLKPCQPHIIPLTR